MKKFKLIILIFSLLIIVLIPWDIYSRPSSDTVNVTLQLFIPSNGMVVFLKDLDLTNLSTVPMLFSVTITNSFTKEIEIVMRLGVIRDGHTLIEGTTYPFTVPSGVTFLTNKDLHDKYPISQTNVDLGGLENLVYSTGRLPTGYYQFFVNVEYQQNNIDAYDEEVLNIADAPTVIDLITPGQRADDPNLIEIYTPLPFFVWHSNARKFRVTVCEKLSTNTSPSDVMNNEPRWQQDRDDDFTFCQYPSSGAWPLEEGKTYYWQIVAIVESSSGPVELESEIWGFKIRNLSGGMFSMQHQQLLALLTLFLGDGKLEDLFEKGGALEGFTFTGMMLNNDQQITQEDLIALIEKIFINQIKFDRYFVE